MAIIVSLFFSGLLFGSGPCLASCGPILISYIAGRQKNIPQGIISYLLFSFGRILVYIGLSLFIFFLGKISLEKFIAGSTRYIFIAAGSFVIILGLLMALGSRFKISSCSFLHQILLEKDKKSVVALGLIMGLLPCAPLLAILSYIGLVSKSWINSLVYASFFGIGTFISPLILLVIFAGLLPRVFGDRQGIYLKVFNFVCGIIIIFYGTQLIKRGF